MARVTRLSGALLAESNGEYFLIGNTKSPCDWAAAGFEHPGELDPLKHPYIRLSPLRPPPPLGEGRGGGALTMNLEGEPLAQALAQRFLIERNGSVSERLWRLVLHRGDADAEGIPDADIDARWLGEIPAPLWQIVRDTVLRCL
ncbi:precorrin-3B C(17)-methyltransferase [Pendulispora rubella]|uniref:Precorrin-3B C(17)-methyltransferase n=1 Tax=Pendulispora rubella TaxID=2741070 RepID=A0ABZ2L389_9BACT